MELRWRKIIAPSRAASCRLVEQKFSKFSCKNLKSCIYYLLAHQLVSISAIRLFHPSVNGKLFTRFTDRGAISVFSVFFPFESCYFSLLSPILLKLQFLACLIESFPLAYGLCSCIGIKLSIPLEAHALRSSMERGSRVVIFSLLSCPAEKCIFQLS